MIVALLRAQLPKCGTMRRMVLAETRNPLTELRRGVLEHCVLALIRDDESCGHRRAGPRGKS
jgi:hypothetical protein